MEQVFTAPTLEEANRKANQWWAQQKGCRLMGRSQMSAKLSAQSSGQGASVWTVVIVYEALHSWSSDLTD
jgi:hypothetical protein